MVSATYFLESDEIGEGGISNNSSSSSSSNDTDDSKIGSTESHDNF